MVRFTINVILHILFCFVLPATSFDVFWNVPSQQCPLQDFESLLSTYGIRVNRNDKFQGGNITIFYDQQLGLYPHISKSGKFENGGIPQRGDLTKHLEQAVSDLQKIIPDAAFNGLGVIDWEAWRPAWDLNWSPLSIYQEKSKEYVREMNSTLNETAVTEMAKRQWEEAAKSYMLETILLSKKLRPQARWGYYLFPDCYNYEGEKPEDFECSQKIQTENNKLEWLWRVSTAIFPSIYLYKSHMDKYTLEQRTWKDQGKLKEAFRVASSNAKIFPYVNYEMDTEDVSKAEFERIAGQIAALGGDGFIIWGSSASVSNQTLCQHLINRIIEVLGPVAEMVTWKSHLCSTKICNGRGKCTWPQDKLATAWKLFRIDSTESFYARDIVCKCEEKYSGRFCNN